MSGNPGSNAERALAICSLFESEVLIWLLLRTWQHPFAEDATYRNELLESATAVLDEYFLLDLRSGDWHGLRTE